jgi:hypothetical protein
MRIPMTWRTRGRCKAVYDRSYYHIQKYCKLGLELKCAQRPIRALFDHQLSSDRHLRHPHQQPNGWSIRPQDASVRSGQSRQSLIQVHHVGRPGIAGCKVI